MFGYFYQLQISGRRGAPPALGSSEYLFAIRNFFANILLLAP